MDYTLKTTQEGEKTLGSAAQALAPLLEGEKANLIIAVACVIISSASSLLGPAIVGQAGDQKGRIFRPAVRSTNQAAATTNARPEPAPSTPGT